MPARAETMLTAAHAVADYGRIHDSDDAMSMLCRRADISQPDGIDGIIFRFDDGSKLLVCPHMAVVAQAV